jgi:hypothetical protein
MVRYEMRDNAIEAMSYERLRFLLGFSPQVPRNQSDSRDIIAVMPS